ncbi:hypothetical protein FYZ48_25745 [Gimesia chilikensis]|uniref:cytochrome C oxidase subunit IV family protein n=1 Tax=Gimesia chilikensis TaxID=2605989 RepID=UPI0011EF62BD|nr:cytochrome C oxidase subunit IV family protein [Gimesia chilikensis]KAA0131548.1 hypothetical protein FYZ48_25745 [Gimesia chilikensis]
MPKETTTHSDRHASTPQLVWTCVLLMALLLLTVGLFQLPLGAAHLIAGLTIAVLKTLLIVSVFMNLRWGVSVLRLTAIAGVLWLAFAILGVMTDYRTRGLEETIEPGLEPATHYSASDHVSPAETD